MISLTQSDKHTIDIVSVATTVSAFTLEKTGVLVNNLPNIALGLTILWTIIRIWETETVKKLTKRGSNGEETNND